MRAYVTISGLIFAILAIVHLLRLVAEGPGVATEPAFAASTLVSVGMSAWALWVARRSRTGPAGSDVG